MQSTETIESARLRMAKELLRLTVVENPYIPKRLNGYQFPSLQQFWFLTHPAREILYGGAAGGGKSAGALAAALQYVRCPGYAALVLRRSFADLIKPGALIPMSWEWLSGTDAKYNAQLHQWTFPSGATITFGHAQNEQSVIQDYQGSQFGFMGFDELTQFPLEIYRYLIGSRLRKPVGLPFPIRVRATSNPGGEGHEWVRNRFIDGGDGMKRLFIPAKLEDNPGLDPEEYDASMQELDPVTRAQLRHGDWETRPEGDMFKRAWFDGKYKAADELPQLRWRLRFWDLAATKKKASEKSHDPDWAVGVLAGVDWDGHIYVLDVRRFRETPAETNDRVKRTADEDGTEVSIRIEQEPGATSKLYIDGIAASLPAYDVRPSPALTDKRTRARPASAACERGNIWICRGNWVAEFIDELCAFKGDGEGHDDQVDAFTGAYRWLVEDAPTPDCAPVSGGLANMRGAIFANR